MENKKSKKVWKIILLVVIIIIVLFLIHTIRNLIIISKLHSKTTEYTESTNFHVKMVAQDSNGSATINYYKKDNRVAHTFERNNNGKISKLLLYNNGNRIDIFTETEEEKIARLDSNVTVLGENGVYSILKTNNMWQAFVYSAMSRIKSVKYNDKDCYSITSKISLENTYDADRKEEIICMIMNDNSVEIYIDKDTGLNLKRITSAETVEKKYEFNSVDDSIFIEPDISQYELKK